MQFYYFLVESLTLSFSFGMGSYATSIPSGGVGDRQPSSLLQGRVSPDLAQKVLVDYLRSSKPAVEKQHISCVDLCLPIKICLNPDFYVWTEIRHQPPLATKDLNICMYMQNPCSRILLDLPEQIQLGLKAVYRMHPFLKECEICLSLQEAMQIAWIALSDSLWLPFENGNIKETI